VYPENIWGKDAAIRRLDGALAESLNPCGNWRYFTSARDLEEAS